MHQSSVMRVVFSPDGQALLTASRDATARLWEIPSAVERLRSVHTGSVFAVAFSPDGQRIASGDNTGGIRIWGGQPGDQIIRLPQRGDVVSVAYSRDGRSIASVDRQGDIRLWDALGSAFGDPIHPAFGRAEWMLFSADGQRLVAQRSNETWLLDAPSGANEIQVTGWRDVNDVVINEQYIVGVAPGGGEIRVFSTDSGQLVQRLPMEERVSDLNLSSDGKFLVTVASAGPVEVYALPGGNRIMRLSTTAQRPQPVAVSPMGDLLATATNNVIVIADLPAGTERRVLSADQEIRALWFSPHGDKLIALAYDRVSIFDTHTGMLVGQLQHQGEIRARALGHWRGIAISRTNDVIATLSDGKARIWSLADGAQLGEVGDGNITAVTFSPDGRWVLTGDTANLGVIWRWRAEDLIDTACERIGRDINESEWGKYFGQTAWRATCSQTPQAE